MIVDPYRFGGYPNNYALSLDGISKYINIDNVRTSLAATTKGTIDIWLTPVSGTPSVNQCFMAFGDTDGDEFLRLFLFTDGKIYVDCRDAGTTQWAFKSDAAVFSSGVRTNIIIAQDAVEPVMYIDGLLEASTFSTSTNKTKWFSALTGLDNGRIGCNNFNSGGNVLFFNGKVDEAGFFDVALSSVEASEANGEGTPPDLTKHSKAANLIDHYRIGDDSRDNYNSDVVGEWRLYSDGTAANTADTNDCEESDMVPA